MNNILNITYKYVIPLYLLFITYVIISNIYLWDYYYDTINKISIVSKIIVFITVVLFILHKYFNYNCKIPYICNKILSLYVIISAFIYYFVNVWFVYFNTSNNAIIEFCTNMIYSYLLYIYFIITEQCIFSRYTYDINKINFCKSGLISCIYYFIIKPFTHSLMKL